MKYYVIAGEASGDLHGSNLIGALNKIDTQASYKIWGGDLMKNAIGNRGTLQKHYKDLAFMGFVEVVQNLPTILKNIKFCKQDILDFKPDALVLIDYPGFNLRIAKFAKKHGVKVFYYISPQLWAWKEGRIKILKNYVDELCCVLPFEVDFYKKHNYPVHYVGHPLLDALNKFEFNPNFKKDNELPLKPIVALLPGSRVQEVKTMLPLMVQLSQSFTKYQFVIAGVNHLDKDFYLQNIGTSDIKIVYNQTYDLLKNSSAAVVTSGTATLETALLNIPQLVGYKGSKISYEIGKRLVKIKYISLVNLIADKPVLKEYIQKEYTLSNVKGELNRLLEDENYKASILNAYSDIRNQLGENGASETTAKLLQKLTTSSNELSE